MSKLLRRHATFCLFVAVAQIVRMQLIAAPPTTVGPDQQVVTAVPASVVESIRAAMEKFDTPGLSVAAIDGGRIAWAEGFGVCEEGTNRPVTPQTRFQAASISKPVTAALVGQLIDAGKLNIDLPINTVCCG